ncbi:MAG: nitronate monooxygenase family protein [Alphaproteobacteria bacterium]|nr:nitronate monooxygenase family protein [Alphaproteobacteria bacterium]
MPIRTPVCDMFGIEKPIFLAGMGGVAYAQVCAAVSQAGGYGTLGMAAATPEEIRTEMRAVRALTKKPFGVDLLAAQPETIDRAIDIIIEEGASSFIAGLGVPHAVIEKCHKGGLKVVVMCGKVAHAQKAEQAGCDMVVAQGTEAGGHTGQVAGMAVIPQIASAVKIPVLAAGAIVAGRTMAAALALGAQGVWVGTRFIAATEARAGRVYQEQIMQHGGADTLVTKCFSGKTMRVIRNAYVDDWEKRKDELQPFPKQMVTSLKAGVMGVTQGPGQLVDPDRACLPAGQGIGGIHDVRPAAEIIDSMMRECEQTFQNLNKLLS